MNPLLIGLGIAIIGGILLGSKKSLAYMGGKPVEVDLVSIGSGFKLRSDAANSFIAMRASAARYGIELKVNSAFRSMDEQTRLWNMYQAGTGNLAARPGYSNHQSGIALDVDVDGNFASPVYKWLNEFAGQFDWINTGKYFSQKEPWHWEYKP